MKNVLLVVGGLALGALAAGGGAGARPEAEAQTAAAPGGAEPGPVLMGIGSSQPNQNDLCWILFRDRPRRGQKIEHDRFALCLYRAINNGQAFDLADVREVTYDFKAVQLALGVHNPRVGPQALKEAFEKARKEAEEAPPGR